MYGIKTIQVLTRGPVAPAGPLSPGLPDSPCYENEMLSLRSVVRDILHQYSYLIIVLLTIETQVDFNNFFAI